MNHEHFMVQQHSFKLHEGKLIEVKGEIDNHKSTDQVDKKVKM